MNSESKSAADITETATHLSNLSVGLTSVAVGIVYYLSNPSPNYFYNYTYLVAGRLLRGSVGLTEQPSRWLNEFVPLDGYYYSVFPLGSVVAMIPAALLNAFGIIHEMPSAFLASLCAGTACLFILLIARHYPIGNVRVIVMTLGFLFGTWTWTNLTFGGAWQLALGFALVGGLGSIYFTVFDRKPFIAGVFFALAFGNRTEVLLTAPILMYLLTRPARGKMQIAQDSDASSASRPRWIISYARPLAWFCSVPFLLGVSTLIYNFVRFNSFTDFGYSRIPGVLEEPWYSHGIFSVRYIPGQLWEMFMKPWITRTSPPYLLPDGFSSSIIWSSPFILFAARAGSRDRLLKYLSWATILAMCLILWMHGNSGGWQFGYRYAMVCLPWLLVILLESSPPKVTLLEGVAYFISIIINAYATWLFHWSGYLRPW